MYFAQHFCGYTFRDHDLNLKNHSVYYKASILCIAEWCKSRQNGRVYIRGKYKSEPIVVVVGCRRNRNIETRHA